MYIENSYKNCQIKLAGKYDQLHIMTTYPTKYIKVLKIINTTETDRIQLGIK